MSPLFRLLLAAALVLLLLLPPAARAELLCTGDCNGDLVVDDAEIAVAVASLFDEAAQLCAGGGGSSPATAADLLAAVRGHAKGCNTAPVLAEHDVYRSYSGYEIALPLAADDPDGPLEYSSEDLPEGAVLEADTGILRWTPGAGQIGPFYIHYRVVDHGEPPAASDGVVGLRITPLDTCAIPTCDPATGCTSTLPPLSEACCTEGPVERTPEVVIDCPGGKVLLIGRNTNTGFGRMQNCDQLRLLRQTQAGVTVRIHIAARCATVNQILTLHSTLDSPIQRHTDRLDTVILRPTSVGFDQRLNVTLDVRDAVPALEGMEANLSLALHDGLSGLDVGETIRVRLTHDPIADLPDLFE